MSPRPQFLVDRRVIAHGQSQKVDFGKKDPTGIIDWKDPDGISSPLHISLFSQLDENVPIGLLLEVEALQDQIAVEAMAQIQWGDGGTQSTVFVDVDRSTTIGLTGSWVRVAVRNLGLAGLPIPPRALFSCHISEATIGGSNPPARLTSRFGALASSPALGSDVIIAVPPFAFSVRPVVPYPSGPGRVELEQLDAVGVVLQRQEYSDTDQVAAEYLHNATRAVRVRNAYPVPLPLGALLWGLAL